MDTGERRLLDPSEVPTKPSIRLPLPPLPAALPRVPLASGRVSEDGVPTRHPLRWLLGGFRAVTGAFPGPAGNAVRKEMGHGSR
jgi:hypothetical protein